MKTGANLGEMQLNTSNVTANTFGKLFTLPIDGFTYAQPLYVPGIAVPGQGTHNIVYVATAHDSVYAFDADAGTLLWKVSLGTAVPSSVINTPNILVEVGIIGTPVIDPSTQTLYVVSKTYESSQQIFRLHALDITTGAEKFGGPKVIAAKVNGTGDGNDGAGHVPFITAKQNQRSALTLINGTIYIAFGSHEDYDPYHGWILAYRAVDLSQLGVYNVTPNGGRGGVWMGGQGLVADTAGEVYFMTGNSSPGNENSAAEYGDSFVKLSLSGTALGELDYFKPGNYDTLNVNDEDLGSGGPVAIPGTGELVGVGKEGVLYVLSSNNLGKLNLSADNVLQKFGVRGGLWGAPVFWNNPAAPSLYLWGAGNPLQSYLFHPTTGLFDVTPSSQSSISTGSGYDPCGSLSVSSNGSTSGTGIIWASIPLADPDHATVQGTLCAFDATNLTKKLWDSRQNPARDDFGNFAKFVPPTVVNGKVYMGTDSGQVCVYGLLANPSPPPAPTGLLAARGNHQVTLSWTAQATATSYNVYVGTQPGREATLATATGLTSTNYTQSGLIDGTTYYYKVASVNANGLSGYSNEASATPTSATGTIVSLDFVGGGTNGYPAALGGAEVAGVISAANWNNGAGASGAISTLKDNLGGLTGATVSWVSDSTWSTPIPESAGNARMMKGYLNTPTGKDKVTVTVSKLPAAFTANGYDVYVYVDGDNGGSTRVGSYTIGTQTVTETDTSNFSGTFKLAANSVGNYLKFSNVGGSGFTLTAVPGATTDDSPRSPVNGIEIVARPPLVSVKSVASGLAYTATTAAPGVRQFFDRSYTITSLSTGLMGGTLIQTGNADWSSTANPFLTLTLSSSAKVFLCYDGRGTVLPAWLSDGTWSLSSETFASTNTDESPVKVYSKSFSVGDVLLGGNLQAPASGARSNYSVIVKAN